MGVDLYDRVLGSPNHQRSDPMILRAGKVRKKTLPVLFEVLKSVGGFPPITFSGWWFQPI